MSKGIRKSNTPRPPSISELSFLYGVLTDRQSKNEAAKRELDSMLERQKRELTIATPEQLELREAIQKDLNITRRILYWVHSEGQYLITKGKI